MSLGPTPLALSLLAAVALADSPEAYFAGSIDDPSLREISGLAVSRVAGQRFWVINDNHHPATITALDDTGRTLGLIKVADTPNRDWEDLDAFEWEGRAYLAVADTGDNDAQHKQYFVHIVEEPASIRDEMTLTPAWTVSFRYPDGQSRDCESLSVDAEENRIYVLSKRGFPATLYSMDLRDEELQTAVREVDVRTIPQPTANNIKTDPRLGRWIGQPTAMTFASSAAVLLTYRHAYWYSRKTGQSWRQALSGSPLEIRLPRLHNAEAIAVAGDRIYVTSENWPAPLIWTPVPGAADRESAD